MILMTSNSINFTNLTPHDVNVILNDGTQIVFPKTGIVPRASEVRENLEPINGIPVVKISYGQVECLPTDLDKNGFYIVSMLVGPLMTAMGFTNVYGPDTSPSGAVRNEKGQVTGCKGLVKY